MNTPYYTPDDHPDLPERTRMWDAVQAGLPRRRTHASVLIHWRSFMLGNAAALLLLFSGIGVWSVVNSASLDRGQRVDHAYETAMNTILGVSPELIEAAPQDHRARLQSTVTNIEDIDRVIIEIRDDMLLNGTSEIKQRQLRQMYARKMDYLKDLLLAGEVEL